MKRQTKIICTLGPASDSKEMIYALAKEGMNVARLNFSHGTHEYHQKIIDNIRQVNRSLKEKIFIMQDLEGYRIRIGQLPSPIALKEGSAVSLRLAVAANDVNIIPLDCDFDLAAIKKGMHIFITDGTIDLIVTGVSGKNVKAKVVQGGTISSKKNVNIPGLKLGANIFTEKDRLDLEFGIKNQVDFVAQSFVRNKRDIESITKKLRSALPECKVIAKIECTEAIRNLDKILDACDGIIIARGDLGVSVPIYQVPVWQKKILYRSNCKNKIDITATQMLETMTNFPRPTRAEVNDVANAVLDGSGYVMLSGETAMGQFPVQAVAMMRQIIEYTEKEMILKFADQWIYPAK
jgi:pyruvate kinase